MWDMNSLRKIAGLQESYEIENRYSSSTFLAESWDDEDDDDDEDVKRLEKEAKKVGVKLPKVKTDYDEDLHALALKRTPAMRSAEEAKKAAATEAKKKADLEAEAKKKAEERKEASRMGGLASYASQVLKNQEAKKSAEQQPVQKVVQKSVEKDNDESAGPKKRGKAVDPNSKTQKLKAWMDANPGAPRKDAWAHAEKELAFTKAGFSTIYQGLKGKRIKECYVLRHPTIPSFILSENGAMNQYQWISDSDIETPLNPMIFESKQAAAEVINYLQSFKNQTVELKWVDLS